MKIHNLVKRYNHTISNLRQYTKVLEDMDILNDHQMSDQEIKELFTRIEPRNEYELLIYDLGYLLGLEEALKEAARGGETK